MAARRWVFGSVLVCACTQHGDSLVLETPHLEASEDELAQTEPVYPYSPELGTAPEEPELDDFSCYLELSSGWYGDEREWRDIGPCPAADGDGDGFCDPWVREVGLSEHFIDECQGVDRCPEVVGRAGETVVDPYGQTIVEHEGCPDVYIAWDRCELRVRNPIEFDETTGELAEGAVPVLDEVARLMQTMIDERGASFELHVIAGVDSALAQQREHVLWARLTRRGVPHDRLDACGHSAFEGISDRHPYLTDSFYDDPAFIMTGGCTLNWCGNAIPQLRLRDAPD